MHLAKIRGVPPEQLAPTVHSWLVDLKASGLPPPSRQRSAPSILAPNVAGRIHEAGTTNNSNQARAGAMRPLPQSAAATCAVLQEENSLPRCVPWTSGSTVRQCVKRLEQRAFTQRRVRGKLAEWKIRASGLKQGFQRLAGLPV